MANFVSYENAATLMTDIGNKIKALGGAYILRGSVTFANLPDTLTKAMTGYVYNVTTDFTTDARFVEGAGKKYSAGTNVAVANLGDDTTPDMKFDVIGNFVDVDGIMTSVDAVSDMITAEEFDDTKTYSVGDIVKHEDTLYKFKAAHTAGDWDAAEVDAVTVLSLIEAAEPDSLTAAQIAALQALLD